MIIEKKCSCGFVIRANGSDNFYDACSKHFSEKHPRDFEYLNYSRESIEKEFKRLLERHPSIRHSFGFWINWDVVLEEGLTFGDNQ